MFSNKIFFIGKKLSNFVNNNVNNNNNNFVNIFSVIDYLYYLL